jgi:hypothetical protein
MSAWDELIHESKRLEETASKIQVTDIFVDGTPKGYNMSVEEMDQLIHDYHYWYGDCQSILPDDLKEKFRLRYDGDGYSITKCIRKFFDVPLKYKQSNGRVGYRGMRVYDAEWL